MDCSGTMPLRLLLQAVLGRLLQHHRHLSVLQGAPLRSERLLLVLVRRLSGLLGLLGLGQHLRRLLRRLSEERQLLLVGQVCCICSLAWIFVFVYV